MTKVPLIIKQVAVHKAPGFARGMKAIEKFAAHVNIIAGPNASGKSTTARAIQKLIWRTETQGQQLDGSIIVDADQWEIRIDSEYVQMQRNGMPAELAGIPDSLAQSRYYLALHELVIDDEKRLASEIMKQSIGGFDLDKAVSALNYSAAIKTTRISEYTDLRNAASAYKQLLADQLTLKKEQDLLADLYDDQAVAEAAVKRKELFARIIELIECKKKHEALTKALNDFPSMMKNIRGGEVKQLDEQEQEIKVAMDIMRDSEVDIQRAKSALQHLRVSADGIPAPLITELEQHVEEISEAIRRIQLLERELEGYRVEQNAALYRIDNTIDPEVWRDWKVRDISSLDQWLQEMFPIIAEKEAKEAEIRILEEKLAGKDESIRTTESILEGITHLGHWLKAIDHRQDTPVLLIALIVVGGLTAAFFTGWPALAAACLIIVLFVLFVVKRGENNGKDLLSMRQRDFDQTGLAGPVAWTVGEVTSRLGELTAELKDAYDLAKAKTALQNCSTSLREIDDRLSKSLDRRQDLISEFGAAPQVPEPLLHHSGAFYWFIQSIRAWQQATMAVKTCEADLSTLREQSEAGLARCNELLQAANFDTVAQCAEAKASLLDLKKQEAKRAELAATIEQQKLVVAEQERRLKRAQNKVAEIYHNAGMASGDRALLSELERQLKQYQDTCKEYYAFDQRLSVLDGKIRHEDLDAGTEAAIIASDLEYASTGYKKYETIASGLPEINRKITEIETKVQTAMQGRVLEEKLAEQEAAKEKLQSAYRTNLASLTGNILIGHLKNVTREQNQSAVFRRANEIFNQITNGRYELRLGENFSAYDTSLNIGQSLSEISTGTRVQLLMAVRLAWVESNESSLRIPILADELLANSDEERAGAIIESLISISRSGRQVFYFTAQADEVHKWQSYLQKHPGVESSVVMLTGRSGEVMDLQQQRTPVSKLFSVPAPRPEESHVDYVLRIGAEGFNILTQSCEEVPLWLLIKDVVLLHSCLELRINTWGQLASFKRHHGKLERLSDEVFSRMEGKMKLLERFQEFYQKGRPKRIDRAVLEQSGSVSPVFIDEVSGKLAELDGDPQRLVEALREKAVRRFTRKAVDTLEEYLLNEGYLSDEEPMSQQEIMIALSAVISHAADPEGLSRFIAEVMHPKWQVTSQSNGSS